MHPRDSIMSGEEKVKTVHEEDDQGNILVYPVWNKKNAPKENQDKWEVPIYLWLNDFDSELEVLSDSIDAIGIVVLLAEKRSQDIPLIWGLRSSVEARMVC